MTSDDKQLQRGMIITDDISTDPILDFNLYRDTIIDIIKRSYPKFTIGIFGEWGTGKTTLMQSINKELDNHKSIITVKFETWRYERENEFALVPLLKTIAFSLPNKPEYFDLKRRLKRGGMNFIKKTPDILSSFLTKYLGDETGKITKEMFDSFKKEFDSRVELLSEVDKDTLYFDGLEEVKAELENIRKNDPDFRIVVFVDDLDRCSPKKTLEILESIKIFLGMDGFIYVIGISYEIVSKLIDIEYEKSGIKGEQYIKKIIQIPITLPKWDDRDITKLVNHLLEKKIVNEKYQTTIAKNIDIISTAIENNPREMKRFLNNFIVAYEIFKNNGIESRELLVLQAIQLRWNCFYQLLISSGSELTSEIKKYLNKSSEERARILESENKVDNYDNEYRISLRNLKINMDLWNFLEEPKNVIFNINDWNPYRRAIESTRDITAVNEGTAVRPDTIAFESIYTSLNSMLKKHPDLLDSNENKVIMDQLFLSIQEFFQGKVYKRSNLVSKIYAIEDLFSLLHRNLKAEKDTISLEFYHEMDKQLVVYQQILMDMTRALNKTQFYIP
jgi:hypothetical protein